ncbi:hypothetical protein ACO0LG_01720 [Undibacterium sp. Ji42W]|uniref:hypothetical protein n=1 Tax=Undibacterium sp. Ji42W TaxID=3413039 RepID=UPI003BF215DE
MREFISRIAFLFAFLSLIAVIIGMISPKKFAENDQPAPTRKSIFFTFIFVALILSGVGYAVSPGEATSTISQQDSDVVKLQRLHAEIGAIENKFAQQMDDFSGVLQRILLKKEVPDLERTKPVDMTFGEILETLEKSNSIKVPDVTQADARRYMTDAVDAHKKWALTMQAKIAALSKGNIEQVKRMNATAESFAVDEAMALGLAYKALGLPIQ